MKIDVTSIRYQRNGICGIGFYAVGFNWHDGAQDRRMIATLFPNERADGSISYEHYAVVDIDHPREAWRGDHFVDVLAKAIAKAGDAVFAP